MKGLWEVLVAGLLSVSFIACVFWKETSEEFSGEAEIPDDKQNPEGFAEKEDAAPTDEDLQAAIEAARQRRLEADKKSL